MDFACELMDLCRGTQEVEAILGEENGGTHDPLARLRLGIQYDEKKVDTIETTSKIHTYYIIRTYIRNRKKMYFFTEGTLSQPIWT